MRLECWRSVLLVSGIGCIYLLCITPPPTFLALSLFRSIRVPNFGASPPGSPGQSRDHTLLPKRPRMPAKGFIDDDWTNGSWRVGAGQSQRKSSYGNTSAWGLTKESSSKRWGSGQCMEKMETLFPELHSQVLLGLSQAWSALLGITFCSFSAAVKVPDASYLENEQQIIISVPIKYQLVFIVL